MAKASLKATGFHLQCPSVAELENLAWSETLGMKKEDAAPWHEVGAMIRHDPALMATLRDALFITPRRYLAGDYLTQTEVEAKEMR